MTGIVLSLNLLLRLVFILYGYIATEEGTLLYNQQLAYSGRLPFIDYDAWSSLFHDYLLGWHQLIFGTSIVNQRLVGLTLALIVFWLTLKLARQLHPPSTRLTALLLTLGSPFYLYFSTIPYSEQFMTWFIILSLFWLARHHHLAAFLAAIAASLIRSQALPITFLIWLYLFFTKSYRHLVLLTLAGAAFSVSLLSPFLLTSPAHVPWALFWPLKANKVLIYQQGFQGINLSALVNFTMEVARDYGVLLAIIMAGFLARGWPAKHRRFYLLILTFLVSQSIVALVHQPPYASYLYPFVPLMALLAGRLLTGQGRFSLILVCLVLSLNWLVFPHAQFVKTSLVTIKFTPHAYLDQIASDLRQLTPQDSPIFTLYAPPVIQAHRRLPENLNRDRFSLSLLDDQAASRYHLTSLNQLQQLISRRQFPAIILTDHSYRVLNQPTLDLIGQHYVLTKTYPQISFIEDPKTKNLYLYLPR